MSENLSGRSLLEKTGQGCRQQMVIKPGLIGLKLHLSLCCVCIYMSLCMHSCGLYTKVRDNLQDLVLSFHQDPGTVMQIIRPGGKHVYSLSHLAGLKKSLVSEGHSKPALWLTEGLALGKCFLPMTSVCRASAGGLKGQMAQGEPSVLLQVGLCYSMETDEFVSGARER